MSSIIILEDFGYAEIEIGVEKSMPDMGEPDCINLSIKHDYTDGTWFGIAMSDDEVVGLISKLQEAREEVK